MHNNCLGCDIANKKISCPGSIILKTNNFIVNQDFEIPIEAFFVIGSKRHCSSLSDFSKEESEELMKIMHKIEKILHEKFKIKKTYLFQDEHAEHFHLWIFPHHAWMDKFGRGIQFIPSIIEFAKKNPAKDEDILKGVDVMKKELTS